MVEQADWPDNGFADWVGYRQEGVDILTQGLVERFAATVPSCAQEGQSPALPLCLHWCLAPLAEPASRLGPDGHPALGLHLPPIAHARRMWAGGALSFHDGLRIGDEVRRLTTIRSIERKTGRSGPLVFVEVQHEFSTARGPAVTERQDLVYRLPAEQSAAPAAGSTSSGASATAEATIATDPVLLFRYSALTFNGHRIHYDQPYATGVEGYRGLVVHGPLIATMLANLANRTLDGIRTFEFRARAPLICGETLALHVARTDAGCALEARCAEDGRLIMAAKASPD